MIFDALKLLAFAVPYVVGVGVLAYTALAWIRHQINRLRAFLRAVRQEMNR